MAFAVVICRGLLKPSLRSNCTPRNLMLFFHSITWSPRAIFGYWKDHLFLTSSLASSALHTTSASSAKAMMLVSAGRSMRRKLSYMTFQTCGPIAQIVIHNSQRLVWNLLTHHHLDAAVPPRSIKSIAYVNADQRAESLTLTSSFSCLSGDVHHCLDGVNCGPAFPKNELVLRKAALADHATLQSM